MKQLAVLFLCLLCPAVLADSHEGGVVVVPESCGEDTPCKNFGSCVEGRCYCGYGFDGEMCETPIHGFVCNDTVDPCALTGMCINGACICDEGYGGGRCDEIDDTHVCPEVVADDDAAFLPLCTLKRTLTLLSSCVNAELPYTVEEEILDTCEHKMLQTVGCFGRVVQECSISRCSSAYDIDGFATWVNDVFDALTNRESEVFKALSKFVCVRIVGGTLIRPNITLGIGEPVCDSDIVDTLLGFYFNAGDKLVADASQTCSALDVLRHQIYNTTRDKCNWVAIKDVNAGFAWAENHLELAHSIFLTWVIPACIPCELPCTNGGSCVTSPEYEQYCECPDGYSGMTCETSIVCNDTMSCENNGYCYEGTCVCHPNTTGSRCEVFDPTHVCPDIREGDAPLLPTCTLKDTLGAAMYCINSVTPISEPYQSKDACQGKMLYANGCFLEFVGQCSKSTCPSLWHWPGVSEWAKTAFADMLDTDSGFMMGFSSILCATFEGGSFVPPKRVFDIGAPVCMRTLFDNLARMYINTANKAWNDTANACSYAAEFRDDVVQRLKEDCDWQNISAVLPPNLQNQSSHVVEALEIAQGVFANWTIPACRECKNLMCMNNGTCHVAANEMEYCQCWPGFQGTRCEDTSDCTNMTCEHGGKCYRTEGSEMCVCPLGFAGRRCEEITGTTCDTFGSCENGGICDDSSGFPFCACNPGYTGVHCEVADESQQCPNVASDDSLFFPLCTLKTTLAHMSECVNAQLPYMLPRGDMHQCRSKILATVMCWSVVTLECSRSTCPSVWMIPGAQHVAKGIFDDLFDLDSDLMQAVIPFVCSDVGPGGMYYVPDILFNIGAPICDQSLLDTIIKLMVDTANEGLMNPDLTSVCSSLDRLRHGIYDATGTCNFNLLVTHLPMELRFFGTQIVHGLNVAREYFLEWVIPSCRDIDDGIFDQCPHVTEYSSSCQYAEAWMCEYANFRKGLADWRMQFQDWWMSCTNFLDRDWRDWGPMDMDGDHTAARKRRSADWGMMDMRGWEGFRRIWDKSFACPEMQNMACARDGDMKMWRDSMGCMIPYCRGGRFKNSRSLLMQYMSERQYYTKVMAMYRTLVRECSTSSGFESCATGGEGGSGGEATTTARPTMTTSDGMDDGNNGMREGKRK